MSDHDLAGIINRLPGMLYQCRNDEEWTMLVVSGNCEEVTGYTSGELINNTAIPYNDLVLPEDQERVHKIVSDAIRINIPWEMEYRIMSRDGQVKWVWEQGQPVEQDSRIVKLEGFITDITANKKREVELLNSLDETSQDLLINMSLLNEYKKAVDVSSIVSKTTPDGTITYVNDEFCRVSGYKRSELIGRSHGVIRHNETSYRTVREIWDEIGKKRIWKGVLKNRKKDGTTYYIAATIIPILDLDGEINEYISIQTEITELIEKDQIIKQQRTDPLTGLGNRIKLFDDINNNRNSVVALIDIDRFKEINDCYGYEAGDLLLNEMGSFIGNTIRDRADIYRVSVDRFALLKADSISREAFFRLMEEYIRKSNEEQTFRLQNQDLKLSVRIGVAAGPSAYLNAETALGYAKRTGTSLIFYDDCHDLKTEHHKTLEWTRKLRTVDLDEQLILYKQPIIDNRTGEITKYECLVRFREKDGRIIRPYEFLDIAKRSKLYPQITRVVLDKAIAHFRNWSGSFSVNLTIEDILDDGVVDYIVRQLKSTHIANRMIIEIVETEGIENFDKINVFLERIKQLGCRIAIDDFGTGYSNFEYIMKLNADFIKIDGSLIRNIDTDENARAIIEVIVAYSRKLGLKTVAEFVSNEIVFDIAKQLGIDFSQGYHISRPLPVEGVMEEG